MSINEYGRTDDVSLDLNSIFSALWAAKKWIIPLVLVTGAATFVGLSLIPPKYRADARVLIESRELNVGVTDRGVEEERALLDEQGIASQVQLMSSRDVARSVIKDLRLTEHSDFGGSPGALSVVLGMIGLGKDVSEISQEQHALDQFMKHLSVYQIEKTRVITVEFASTDPRLAANVTNRIIDKYLQLQGESKRGQAAQATKWLEQEIDTLRRRVSEAEGRVEQYRAGAGLFVGQNNTSIDQQQLAELSSQLSSARAQKSDAEARARQLRGVLNGGGNLESATEIQNSATFQRLRERAGAIQARIAELSTTLLPGHPQIQALESQRADVDQQMRIEARRVLGALENDARVADDRLRALTGQQNELKAQSAVSNQDDIQLRALEREARAQRELLETFLARYRKEISRQNAEELPPDARVIATALVPIDPYFPKVVPITIIVTLGMFLLACTLVVLRELLNGNALRKSGRDLPYDAPAEVDAAPAPVMMADGVNASTADAVDPTAVTTPAQAFAIAPAFEERSFASVADLWSGLAANARRPRRIVVTTAGEDDLIAHAAALALARQVSLSESVVLVDLIGRVNDIGYLATRRRMPGLAGVLDGTIGFGEAIMRDPASRAHLIPAGGAGLSLDALTGPRLGMIIEALSHTYDHVLLDVGPLVDHDGLADLVASADEIVLVTDADREDTRAQLAFETLTHGGIPDVWVLAMALGDARQRAA